MITYIIWFAILICLFFCFFVLSKMFEKVSIIDNLDRVKVDANGVENAVKNAEQALNSDLEKFKKAL